ncbi:hypothetical protein ACWC9H_27245 [Streptomyces sp. NPDC001251]
MSRVPPADEWSPVDRPDLQDPDPAHDEPAPPADPADEYEPLPLDVEELPPAVLRLRRSRARSAFSLVFCSFAFTRAR